MEDITQLDKAGFATLEILNEAKKFNAWMYSKISANVGNSVLEIGSGIGNITELISSKFIYATDFSNHYIRILEKRFSNESNINVMHFDITNFNGENFKHQIDTVICLNVLEHIDNDLLAIKNIYRILDTGGYLLLLVPYSNLLFCEMDRLLGHFRRYSKKSLSNLIRNSGFTLIELSHFNLFGGIGWFVNGKVLRQKILSGSSVNLFEKLVPIFRVLEFLKIPFGASLICTAKKNISN